MRDVIDEVRASMQNNRQRIWLTGFAIGWGMFILVTLLGSAGGIQKGVYKGGNLDMPQLITLATGKTSIPWNGMNTDRMVEMTLEDANALWNQHFDYVANVYPTFNQAVQAVSGSEYVNTSLTGCTPSYIIAQYYKIFRGRDINHTDIEEQRKVCVLSSRMCREMFGDKNPVGCEVIFDGNIFLVVGECRYLFEGYQAISAYAPISTVMALYSPTKPALSMMQVEYAGIEDLDELHHLTSDIRNFISPRIGCSPQDSKALVIRNDFETVINMTKVLSYLGIFVWIIGIATLLAGVVGVSNIMLITVRERTRELGVRRAMGASSGSIIRLVLIEAVIITMIFGYAGMMLGIGLTQLLSAVLGGSVPYFTDPTVEFGMVVGCNLIMILAGIAAGYVPAKRAVTIKLVDALTS
ncbi:ABC transporter permease [Xylanibacter ruminicola]|uniref:Putative ABC transport system permease protein n=1 Tax=Xylanibacter ruminicola TaxID=839 RepID=A0A1M6YRJ3_XYLRU|nr:ABC transporter permease [Xylanibacter ruminicola]SHL20662.1 putative ABC transport system permease protein [Xylanibacter ruminicola]